MRTYGNYQKLFQALGRYDTNQAAVRTMKDLADIQAIWSFYDKLTVEDLRIILAAIKKTEAQLGYIPFCFSTVPIVFLIFSSKLANLLEGGILVLVIVIIVLSLAAVYLIHRHFTLKSLNALHQHIVESLLQLKSPAGSP